MTTAVFTPTLADAQLEASISVQLMIVMEDSRFTRSERIEAFEAAARLHRQRRPEMVAHLERQRRLGK